MQTQQLWSVKEEELPVVVYNTGSHREALLVGPHLQTFCKLVMDRTSPPYTTPQLRPNPSFVRAASESCRGALTAQTILQPHGDLICCSSVAMQQCTLHCLCFGLFHNTAHHVDIDCEVCVYVCVQLSVSCRLFSSSLYWCRLEVELLVGISTAAVHVDILSPHDAALQTKAHPVATSAILNVVGFAVTLHVSRVVSIK